MSTTPAPAAATTAFEAANRNFNYADAGQCRALLAGLPLTNVPKVRDMLTRLIFGMQRTPPPARDYLAILEAMRAPLAFIQGELAKRYATRAPLPRTPEDEVLRRAVATWLAMAKSYALVAQRAAEHLSDPEIRALIAQRCIHYCGRAIVEYLRARRELPKGLWLELNGYFADAEELGLANLAVSEPLGEAITHQSPTQALAAVMLMVLANPYGRSVREFQTLLFWIDRFAPYTEIMPVFEGTDARTFAIDLDQDGGPQPLARLTRSAQLRRLAANRLAAEIGQLVAQIKAGVPANELGLGQDTPASTAGPLLVKLYRPWCLAANPRRFIRRPGTGEIQIVRGLEGMHYAVSGSAFVQPAPARKHTRYEFDKLVTFGESVGPQRVLHVRTAQLSYPTETWTVLDHSPGGFRLLAGSGTPPEFGELICLLPPDSDQALLAQVSWLMVQLSAKVQLGIGLLPGTPRAVAARPTGENMSPSDPYTRAFLLPAVAPLNEPASLVLPRTWFQPQRVLEVYSEEAALVRLTRLLAHGPNFDRVAFEPV